MNSGYPHLLDTQLATLLEFARAHDIRVLIPMVTLAAEVAQVRRRLIEIAARMGISKLPPLGAMIETPAAALSVGEITEHVDFLSIGTNDLTQYTMAAGRENPLVNACFLASHPAVLRLIRIVLDEAGPVPVTICGELAADLGSIAALLKFGLRSFSVAPPLVPAVKQAIRQAS